MNIEFLREYCLSLPHVTEDIKWVDNLCFCIGGKMFLIADLNAEGGFSFKVSDDDFDELCAYDGIEPAPYLARYKWVKIYSYDILSSKKLKTLIDKSYEMVKDKLPPKIKKTIAST